MVVATAAVLDDAPSSTGSKALLDDASLFCCTPPKRDEAGMEESGKVLVYLVHGTWGRGIFPRDRPRKTPRWFEHGSPFSQRFVAGLEGDHPSLQVVPFLWSGANSITARHEAAGTLADQIRRDLHPSSRTRVVIVAHSHGGNVALMASRLLREEIERDKNTLEIVALATPFLKMLPAKVTGWAEHGPIFLNVTFVFYLFFFQLLYFPPAREGFVHLNEMLPNALSGPVMLLILIFFAALLGVGTSPFTGIATNEGWLGKLAYRYSLKRRDRLLACCPAILIVDRPRILVVRGFNDEANMVLVAGSLGNMLSSWTYNLGGGILSFIQFHAYWMIVPVLAFILLIGLGTFADEQLVPLDPLMRMIEATPWHLAKPTLEWTLLVAYGAMLAAGPFKCVYGRELFLWSGTLEVTADSVPDANGHVDVVTLPPVNQQDDPLMPKWGIRHSIHASAACVDAVVDWISRGPSVLADPARTA